MRRKLTQKQRREINRKNKSNTQEDNNDNREYNIPGATSAKVADSVIADANDDIVRIIRCGDGADGNINDDNASSANSANSDVCPICLECLNTQKVITLHCGHKIHDDCLFKYNSFRLEDNPLKIVFPLNNVRNISNEIIRMIVYLDEQGVIQCPCCRTEHIMLGKTDNDGDVIPKKILARIKFSAIDGFTPIHYIVTFSQLFLYMPKNINGDLQRLKTWWRIQQELMYDIENDGCTDLKVMECTCSNDSCPRVFVVNKNMLDILPCHSIRPMCAGSLKHYVADEKTLEKNIKLLRNLM